MRSTVISLPLNLLTTATGSLIIDRKPEVAYDIGLYCSVLRSVVSLFAKLSV